MRDKARTGSTAPERRSARGDGSGRRSARCLAKAAVDLEGIVGTMLTDLTATGEDVKNIYKV
ncbi:hypothetical protein ACWDX6_29750, partial [Streptomyces sp. NPDC003027]